MPGTEDKLSDHANWADLFLILCPSGLRRQHRRFQSSKEGNNILA